MSGLFNSVGSALAGAVVYVKDAVSDSIDEMATAVRERIVIADWVKEVDALTRALVVHVNDKTWPERADNQANREIFTELEKFGAVTLLNRMPAVDKYGDENDKRIAREFKILAEKDIPSVIESGRTGFNRVIYRCGRIRSILNPNE